MHPPVLEIDIDDHIGVRQRIVGDRLAKKQLAKGHRHIQPQPAGWTLLFRGQLSQKYRQLFGILRQQRVKSPSRLCRLDIARCPVEQAKAQIFLKLFDLLAGRRTGNAETAGSGGKTAAPHNFTEGFDRRIEDHY